MFPRSDQTSHDPKELNWSSRSKDDHTRKNRRFSPTVAWTKAVHDETNKVDGFIGDTKLGQGSSLDVGISHEKKYDNTIQVGTQMMGNHKGS